MTSTMSKKRNTVLHAAHNSRNDEFYTPMDMIEAECSYYKEHFAGKTIYCNCDNPFLSNFIAYFIAHFEEFGLKRLIGTGYSRGGSGIKYDYSGDDPSCSKHITLLEGNGDFRSDECVALLDECDIVITNPPFSLFDEFVSQIIEHKKDFLIIGCINAVTYKSIFPLIMENKMWIGVTMRGCQMSEFIVPCDYKWGGVSMGFVDKVNAPVVKINTAAWFTNLSHSFRNEMMELTKTYAAHEDEYPTYDNFDGINVDRVKYIPNDYDGIMGVPISFVGKYCPEQFEILGLVNSGSGKKYGFTKDYSGYTEKRPDGTPTGRSGKRTNGNPMVPGRLKNLIYYENESGECVHAVYARILIRRK